MALLSIMTTLTAKQVPGIAEKISANVAIVRALYEPSKAFSTQPPLFSISPKLPTTEAIDSRIVTAEAAAK
jgi:hypothetical protein